MKFFENYYAGATLLLLSLLDSSSLGQITAFQNIVYPSEYHPKKSRQNNMVRRGSPTPSQDGSDESSQFSINSNNQKANDNSDSSQQRLSVDTEPHFKIGVLADIQYAPIPDGYSFAGVLRYYRHALDVAQHAAKHFETDGAEVVLNLGDIVDGKCQAITENGGDPLPEGTDPGISAIEDVLDALSHYKRGPIIHTYGNHELYNLDRGTIGKKLDIPFTEEPCGDLVGYHTYVHRNIRFLVMDSYDIAKMGRCTETSAKYKEACEILARENPNFPHNDNSSEGIEGELNRRFVAFNGGVGTRQLEWVRETLQSARENEEKVIVISHQPILPGSSSSICLVWNYEDILKVLREYSDVVVASFAGHAHSGGYKRDEESGIHFRTFEAVLENPHPHKTYGMVEVHDNCLLVQGYGNCESAIYDFDHLSVSQRVYASR